MRATHLALSAVLLLPLLAFAQEEPDVGALVKDFKAAMKSREASERIEAVQVIAETRHEDVAAALSKYLGDRDPKVRAAVARALGAQGDTKYVKTLLGRLRKWDKDDPDAVIGYLDGLARLHDESAVEALADMVRKILSATRFGDQRLGVAAVAVLGKIRAKAAVEELVGLLDLTLPKGAAKGYASEDLRLLRTGHRDAIFTALTSLTGLNIKVTQVWERWWKAAGKKFEIPAAAPDPNAGEVYTAAGYGFTLEKPTPKWKITCPDTVFLVVRLEHRPPGGGRVDAEVYVEAYSTTEYSVQTAEQACDDMDLWARNTGFKKSPEGKPMLRQGPSSAPARMIGQEGMLWRAAGTAASGKEVELRMFFFVRDGLLSRLAYAVHGLVRPSDPRFPVDRRAARRGFTVDAWSGQADRTL